MENDVLKKRLNQALQICLNIESLESHLRNLQDKIKEERRVFDEISHEIIYETDCEFPALISYDNKKFVFTTSYDEFKEHDVLSFKKLNNVIEL